MKQKIKMRSRACSHEHCTEIARFGFWIIPRASLCRSRTFPEYAAPLYCEEHAPEGLVDIVEQRCADCPEIATMARGLRERRVLQGAREEGDGPDVLPSGLQGSAEDV